MIEIDTLKSNKEADRNNLEFPIGKDVKKEKKENKHIPLMGALLSSRLNYMTLPILNHTWPTKYQFSKDENVHILQLKNTTFRD